MNKFRVKIWTYIMMLAGAYVICMGVKYFTEATDWLGVFKGLFLIVIGVGGIWLPKEELTNKNTHQGGPDER